MQRTPLWYFPFYLVHGFSASKLREDAVVFCAGFRVLQSTLSHRNPRFHDQVMCNGSHKTCFQNGKGRGSAAIGEHALYRFCFVA